MGICEIDGLKIRVSDFNVNVKQEVSFYDHIIGLRDSVPKGLSTKGDAGNLNVQKYFWRPGTKICTGSFTFPATVFNLQKTFDLARNGDEFKLTFHYACDDVARVFDKCRVNNFTFTSTAGEVVTVQVDVMGRYIEEGTGTLRYDTPEKLITWDQVEITTDSTNPVQMFTFSVNNNCIPIYTTGGNVNRELFPKYIRVGMQEVTGSVVYYIKGIDYEDLDKDTDSDTIKIKITDDCVVAKSGGYFGSLPSDGFDGDAPSDGFGGTPPSGGFATSSVSASFSFGSPPSAGFPGAPPSAGFGPGATAPDFEEELTVIYKPIERTGSTRALLHTLPFVGVGKALGTP